MRFLRYTICVFLFTFLTLNLHSQAKQSKTLKKSNSPKEIYETILKTGGLFDKQDLGKQLGKFGNSSYPYTNLLLKDKHYWNRIAGIESAEISSDKEIEKNILDLLANDHMTTRESKEFIQKRYQRIENLYLNKIKEENDLYKVKELIASIPLPIPNQSKLFLSEAVSNISDKSRELAFEKLAQAYDPSKPKESDDVFLRSFIEDRSLRVSVLEYIQSKGDKSDLRIFTEILGEKSSPFKEKTIALRALNQWGTISEQKTMYEKILSFPNKEEDLKYVAIHVFSNLKSENIRKELCSLTQNSTNQEVRITAAVELIPYDNIINIPCLEEVAVEKINVSPPPHLGDAALAIITFGITGFVKARNESKRKEHFFVRQKSVHSHLQYLKKWKEEGG